MKQKVNELNDHLSYAGIIGSIRGRENNAENAPVKVEFLQTENEREKEKEKKTD